MPHPLALWAIRYLVNLVLMGQTQFRLTHRQKGWTASDNFGTTFTYMFPTVLRSQSSYHKFWSPASHFSDKVSECATLHASLQPLPSLPIAPSSSLGNAGILYSCWSMITWLTFPHPEFCTASLSLTWKNMMWTHRWILSKSCKDLAHPVFQVLRSREHGGTWIW